MVLIADSGSTKCDWALLDSKGNKLGIYETIGLNPYFHTSEAMSSAIQANAELSGMGNEITNVFFYGAGASTETMCSIVMKGLQKAAISAADLEHARRFAWKLLHRVAQISNNLIRGQCLWQR